MAGKPVDTLPRGLLLAGLSGSRRGKKSCKQQYNSRKDKTRFSLFIYIHMYVCIHIYICICVFTHILLMCQKNTDQNIQLS